MRKKLLFSLIILCTYISVTSKNIVLAKTSNYNPPINRIVAFVNNSVITENQVNQELDSTIKGLKQKNITLPANVDLRSQIIEKLIMDRIQLDLANRLGIRSSNEEVNLALSRLAKLQNMSLEQFRANLAKDGVDCDEFSKKIQEQIIMDKLRQREVEARVMVSDDEISRVLHSEAYKNQVDYNLSDIVISIPEQASDEVIAKKEELAKLVYKNLKSGMPFAEAAVKYSNAANALNGGQLGFTSNVALPPMVANLLKPLKVGDFTEVVRLPIGFFIFKINEIRQHGAPNIVRQYHVRHILIKIDNLTSSEEAYRKIMSIWDKLNESSKNPTEATDLFITLAKQYSQDASSVKGGDLGWIQIGDTVPSFEETVLKTPVNSISKPVLTPFGWHIIQVVEIKDSNLAQDKERQEVRQELHQSKATSLYAQWIREIRQSAFVKINDE